MFAKMPHLVCTALFKVEVRQRTGKGFTYIERSYPTAGLKKFTILKTVAQILGQPNKINFSQTIDMEVVEEEEGICNFWKGLFPSWSF